MIVALPRIIQENIVGCEFAQLCSTNGRIFEVKPQMLDALRVIKLADSLFARINGLSGQPSRNADHDWFKPRVFEHEAIDVGQCIPGFKIEA